MEGNALLAAALDRLNTHASVMANVRYRLGLFDNELVGSGVYLQQGRGTELQLRLELRTQVAGQSSSLQQVADRRYLWTDERWNEEHHISKVNLRQVRRAYEQRPVLNPADMTSSLAIGGLPRLLESLAERFDFGPARPAALGETEAFSITGRLRTKDANEPPTSATASPPPLDLDDLPEHVPNEVVLVLARDDFFPHVVEYRRRSSETGQAAAAKMLVRLELYQVKLDRPIDDRQFEYDSRAIHVADRTAEFLKEHGLTPADAP